MMRVRDVMSVGVVAVEPGTPLKEVATTLISRRIGGVPVLDPNGGLVGLVSESDIQPVRAGAPGRPVRTAADVMTTPVITLMETDTVTEAARVLQRNRIKRAPVQRDGRLVGIITRSDLLRPYLRTDSEILAEVEEEVVVKAMGLVPRDVGVSVDQGVVLLDGPPADERSRALLVRLCRAVDGVVDVVANGAQVSRR